MAASRLNRGVKVAASGALAGGAIGGGIAYATGGNVWNGVTHGVVSGAVGGFSRGFFLNRYSQACFAAGTPLLIDFDGNSRPIEDIKVGDVVLSRDEFNQDGPLELKRVEELFTRTSPLIELVIQGRRIETTVEHPFFVPTQGKFIAAGELKAGDRLLSHDDQLVTLESIGLTDHIAVVYSMRVADHHTYFVGCAEWGFSVWAHNSECGVDSLGRKMFQNDEPHLLEGELRLANALGIEPLPATHAGFAQMAREAEGGKLLWVRRLDGEVVFVPERVTEGGLSYRLNHTAASGGANVLGSGEAFTYVARNNRVTIRELNNGSGHYAPTTDVVAPAAEVIQQQGVGVMRQRGVPGS